MNYNKIMERFKYRIEKENNKHFEEGFLLGTVWSLFVVFMFLIFL